MKQDKFEFFEKIYKNNMKTVINSLCSSKSNFNKEFLDLIAKKYDLDPEEMKGKKNLCFHLQKKIGTISLFEFIGEYFSNSISMFSNLTSNSYFKKILVKTKRLSKKVLFQFILLEGKTPKFKDLQKVLAAEVSDVNLPQHLLIIENDLTYMINFFSKKILELNNIIYGISFSFSRLFSNTNPSYWVATKLNKKDLEIANLFKKWFEYMYESAAYLRDDLLMDPNYLRWLEINESKRMSQLKMLEIQQKKKNSKKMDAILWEMNR